MSKSKGNVVNPDDVVSKYGADVFRVYEMFMGPFDQPVPWDTNGIEGVKRFLDKVWKFQEEIKGLSGTSIEESESFKKNAEEELESWYHMTVKKVTEKIDRLQFNTAISDLMKLLTVFYVFHTKITKKHWDGFLKLLAPFAPHLAEEIWRQSHSDSIHVSSWPSYNSSKLQSATFELVIQINGKVRDRMTVHTDITEEEAKTVALQSDKVQAWLKGKNPQKIVYVRGKLVSIVV